jgi:putative acetyltransferase
MSEIIEVVVRVAIEEDRAAIRDIERKAFGGMGEAVLVDSLVASHDVVLELVATRDDMVVGHVMFSRIHVVDPDGEPFPGVALAPAAVEPGLQGKGVGRAMISAAHDLLAAKGERLSVVLGDPGYYGRFGYTHERAAGFESSYQCDALQAIAFGDAPVTGRLVYAEAFQLH